MKKHLGLLFLFLAACAAATPAPAPLREADIRAAWSKAVPAPAAFAMLAAPTPLGPTTYTSGQCWFRIRGHLAAFDHASQGMHGFTVQCGPTTVLEAYGTSDGQAGAVLNLTGDWPGMFEGPFVHAQQIACPQQVVPEDALIVCSTTTAPGSRGPLPSGPGRSVVDEMLPVVFVSWAPSPAYLRPPAIGHTELARFFRRIPVPISALQVAKLPSVIDVDALSVDWSTWGNEKPTFARSEALFARFCGEVTSGWNTDTMTPDWQNVGYGREQARIASDGLGLLASTASAAAKAALARNMAQRGFDLVGAYASGRSRLAQCNGGHGNGRKALVVLLGWLLDCEPLRNPSAFLGPSFAEDFQYVNGSRWDGGTVRWRYNSTGDASAEWAKPPEQWSAAWVWQVNGYFQHCCGSQIGTALFMRLTGNVDAMSRQMDQVVAWYMSKPSDWQRGPNCWVVWGDGWGGAFGPASWRRYAGQ